MTYEIRPVKFGWTPIEAALELDLEQWLAQQKMDGMRCMARLRDGRVDFLGAGGAELVQAAAAAHFPALRDALSALHPVFSELTLDCEIMPSTGTLHVFDVPLARLRSTGEVVCSPETPVEARVAYASAVAEEAWSDLVDVLPTVRGRARVVDLLEAVRESGAEGVVLKRVGSPYPSRPGCDDWLKVKFYREVDCVVTERNVGACNAHLALYDSSGWLVSVGSASMVGKPDAAVGDVVQVKYLSWVPGGCLVQPSVLRVRRDKSAPDCLLSQLVPSHRSVIEVE